MNHVEKIINYLYVSESIGTAGQPTAAQFKDIKAAGYEIVINLAMPTSSNYISDEDEIVTALGMKYIHIPVVWTSPEQEDLQRFFEIMDQHQNKKVFVHCALNWRATCFIFLYRVIRKKVAISTAREAMLKIWQPDEIWQSFIKKSLEQYGIKDDRDYGKHFHS